MNISYTDLIRLILSILLVISAFLLGYYYYVTYNPDLSIADKTTTKSVIVNGSNTKTEYTQTNAQTVQVNVTGIPFEKQPEKTTQLKLSISMYMTSAPLILAFCLALSWYLFMYYRAHIFLKRFATEKKHDTDRFSIKTSLNDLFPDVLRFFGIAAKLRRRTEISSIELKIDKTVDETVRNGGYFTPFYDTRQVLPEYLVLIDRVHYGDHQAKFIEEFIEQLERNHVFVTVYHFDRDPRLCFSYDGKKPPAKISELATQHNQSRLIVFSDIIDFFNPLSGDLEPWVETLLNWKKEKAVFTPNPRELWGYREHELSEHMEVYHASLDGLNSFIKKILKFNYTLPVTGEKKLYPEELKYFPQRWLERISPEQSLVDEVLGSLRIYLGKDGYLWLCACAVYPEINWDLTVYLGNNITDSGERKLIETDNRLMDIVKLPWFRYSYMPDWLRKIFISELDRQQEKKIRNAITALLLTAVSADDVDVSTFEIAKQNVNSLSYLSKYLYHLIKREASKDSPLHDYIFKTFMTGRLKTNLAIRLTKALERILSNNNSKEVKTFVFSWTLTNTLILPFVFLAYTIILNSGSVLKNDYFLFSVIFSITVTGSLFVGCKQWKFLFGHIQLSRYWILTTVLSVNLLLSMGLFVDKLLVDYDVIPFSFFIIGFVLWSILCACQWLILKKNIYFSRFWVLSSTITVSAASAIFYFVAKYLFEVLLFSLGEPYREILSFFTASFIFSIIYETFTGFTLALSLLKKKV
ncbi:MAG: hypothetical protein HQK94_17855 [Nitrospirae bacterium]|nr:hypothetical protein [Nitrospirota bacterium]